MTPAVDKIYEQGYFAGKNDINPYDYKSEIMKYCAWFAGHTDSLPHK